jgi:hypothetical protein
VTVAVPVLAEVTRPLLLTVATEVGLMVQATEGLSAMLPSLLVPDTVICTVLFWFPVSIVGLAGPTAIELMIGSTKNPRQLIPKASEASAANAPIRRSLDFSGENIVFSTAPIGRPQACSESLLSYPEIVAERVLSSAPSGTGTARKPSLAIGDHWQERALEANLQESCPAGK